MKKILLQCCIFLLLLGTNISIVNAYDVPEPQEGFYVSDYAEVLDEETKQLIYEYNAKLEEKNGSQIVVMTVDFLDGEEIEDAAYDIFNAWGIGSSKYNNGVLLLLVIGEENYYCLQGIGLEKSLSSGQLDKILYDYLETDFAAGEYSQCVKKTVEVLFKRLNNISGSPIIANPPISKPEMNAKSSGEAMSSVLGGFMLVGLVVAGIIIWKRKSKANDENTSTPDVPKPAAQRVVKDKYSNSSQQTYDQMANRLREERVIAERERLRYEERRLRAERERLREERERFEHERRNHNRDNDDNDTGTGLFGGFNRSSSTGSSSSRSSSSSSSFGSGRGGGGSASRPSSGSSSSRSGLGGGGASRGGGAGRHK